MATKKGRITIYDIAQELGIAPSSVSRALNKDTSISEETQQLVWEAAVRLGYKKNILASSLKTRPIKIAVIVRATYMEFQKLLLAGARHAEETLSDYKVSVEHVILDAENYSYTLPLKIAECADMGYDGVIFAPTGTEIRPLIDKCISEKGIKACSFYYNTGFNNVDFSVGADYHLSGKIAASIMRIAGLKKGDNIVYFYSSEELGQHIENRKSFVETCKELGYKVHINSHYDMDNLAGTLMKKAFNEIPDIKGIYSSSATCVPICKEIKNAKLKKKPVVVMTELLDSNISYVKDGTIDAVIFQNPFKLGYMSVMNMYDLVSGHTDKIEGIKINPHIVLRENLEFYAGRITNIDPNV